MAGTGTSLSGNDDLVLDNLDLVEEVVRQVAAAYPSHVDRDELRSAGMLGLVEAARRFHTERGVPFRAFASIRVRGAMVDSARLDDWMTRGARRRTRELDDAEARLVQEGGGTPSAEEIARRLSISTDAVVARRAECSAGTLLQLDRPIEEGEGLGALMPETDARLLPDAALDSRELIGTVRAALDFLSPTHRRVVEGYYLAGVSLLDIASDLGVTQARVSQICSEAVNALRAYLGRVWEGVPQVPDGAPGKRARAAFVRAVETSTNWRDRLVAADRLSTRREVTRVA